MTDPIRLEVDGRIATITMDRPDVRNALTGTGVLEGLIDALERIKDDRDLSVLVLTGAGSAFSAGGNLKDMRAGEDIFEGSARQIAESYRSSVLRLMRSVALLDLVTIAAVNGPAIGGGCDLALLCDLRVGSSLARLGQPVVDLGLVPGDGGAWILPRIVGWQRASELIFTGRIVDAREALHIGLLLEVVKPAELLEHVQELASTIARKPPQALRLSKRLLRHARSADFDAFLDMTAAFQAISHHTEEHRRVIGDPSPPGNPS
jgi:enoyl-CoA hydratase/carnithine racemase